MDSGETQSSFEFDLWKNAVKQKPVQIRPASQPARSERRPSPPSSPPLTARPHPEISKANPRFRHLRSSSAAASTRKSPRGSQFNTYAEHFAEAYEEEEQEAPLPTFRTGSTSLFPKLNGTGNVGKGSLPEAQAEEEQDEKASSGSDAAEQEIKGLPIPRRGRPHPPRAHGSAGRFLRKSISARHIPRAGRIGRDLFTLHTSGDGVMERKEEPHPPQSRDVLRLKRMEGSVISDSTPSLTSTKTSLGDSGRHLFHASLGSLPVSWKLGEVLGRGSYGKVYRALDLSNGELFAVKKVACHVAGQTSKDKLEHSILPTDAANIEDEIQLLRRLDHPNIVKYKGALKMKNTLYIMLEYCPGGSLKHLVEEFGPLPETIIKKLGKQILTGLKYLHDNKTIHRDIKGANVLLSATGEAKLGDFGCSHTLRGQDTATLESMRDSFQQLKGTIPFMAPEALRQKGLSRKSDIWSFGALLIELATGSPPWSEFSNQFQAMFHVATNGTAPTIPDHLSELAKDFLSNCFHVDPARRASAESLLRHPFMATAE